LHGRHKFSDLHAANQSPVAAEALRRNAELYAIEARGRGLDACARHLLRGQEALPKLQAIQSLVATAKLNGIEPAAWLKYALENLPTWPYSRIDELLPLSSSN
jgi:hypothetical protein